MPRHTLSVRVAEQQHFDAYLTYRAAFADPVVGVVATSSSGGGHVVSVAAVSETRSTPVAQCSARFSAEP